jgi:hypothetical protein
VEIFLTVFCLSNCTNFDADSSLVSKLMHGRSQYHEPEGGERKGRMQRGGPSSHKEWTASLHSGNGIVNAGNLLVGVQIRRLLRLRFGRQGKIKVFA